LWKPEWKTFFKFVTEILSRFFSISSDQETPHWLHLGLISCCSGLCREYHKNRQVGLRDFVLIQRSKKNTKQRKPMINLEILSVQSIPIESDQNFFGTRGFRFKSNSLNSSLTGSRLQRKSTIEKGGHKAPYFFPSLVKEKDLIFVFQKILQSYDVHFKQVLVQIWVGRWTTRVAPASGGLTRNRSGFRNPINSFAYGKN